MKIKDYRFTVAACFAGYFVQAAVVTLTPLLLLILSREYSLSIGGLTLLVTLSFCVQLLIDFAAACFADKIGYRATAITALCFSAAGFAGMAFLPSVMPPLAGLILSVVLYSTGGGLLEVVISPLVQACPVGNKTRVMSLLHSFYCWGVAVVVILSTLFFAVFGQQQWRTLVALWTALPIVVCLMFAVAPITTLAQQGSIALSSLIKTHRLPLALFMLLMMCAGAAEQAVSQWASAFAEQALGVSKTVGDCAGPLLFAVCMGTTRALFGRFCDKLPLVRSMIVSCTLCIVAYLLIGLTATPVAGFIGCGLCGIGVGIMWPGLLSASAATLNGGTGMFALLALAGDVGCTLGPGLCGLVSGAAGMRMGLLACIVFPVIMLFGLLLLLKRAKGKIR